MLLNDRRPSPKLLIDCIQISAEDTSIPLNFKRYFSAFMTFSYLSEAPTFITRKTVNFETSLKVRFDRFQISAHDISVRLNFAHYFHDLMSVIS